MRRRERRKKRRRRRRRKRRRKKNRKQKREEKAISARKRAEVSDRELVEAVQDQGMLIGNLERENTSTLAQR